MPNDENELEQLIGKTYRINGKVWRMVTVGVPNDYTCRTSFRFERVREP